MAEVKTRLNQDKRNELGTVLPLTTPYVLLIDPSNLCNLRCVWCPSGYDRLIESTHRPQQILDYSLFKKIIDDSQDFVEPIRVLRLYKEGEPLLNPSFCDMVRYAKKCKNILRIDTTTNGVLLNKELNRNLIDAGIDQINISVNGVSAEQVFRNTGRNIDYSKYIDGIRDLYKNKGECTIYIKCIQDVLSKDEQRQFLDIFGEYADRIYLERLSPAWPDFDFTNSGYQYEKIGNYGQVVENREVCPYIFYIMVVNSDGTVSSCVGDWRHVQLLGDTRSESIRNIWLGAKYKSLQKSHLQGMRKKYYMCNTCKVITHGCYDNIDKYSDRILSKL